MKTQRSTALTPPASSRRSTPLDPPAKAGGDQNQDLFAVGKLNVEPVVMEKRETYYGFFTRHQGQIECSVGRGDFSHNVIVSICDPERGTTQIQISSQELIQEGLRIHREIHRHAD